MSMASGFLMSLFSDMEFFAGLTPGYVAGSSSTPSKSAWGDYWQHHATTWTEKGSAFSLSIDAGMCLNYSIWRFDIKLMPAIPLQPHGQLHLPQIDAGRRHKGIQQAFRLVLYILRRNRIPLRINSMTGNTACRDRRQQSSRQHQQPQIAGQRIIGGKEFGCLFI